MGAMSFSGVYAPLPTPFDPGDRLDIGRMRTALPRWIASPLAGFVLLGTNGEAGLVDDDEAERLIDAVRPLVPGDRTLIAGAGRESTPATVRAVRRAAALGADAVLVRPPSVFKGRMTDDVLVAYYTAVAEASPVPVLLYNFMAATGVNLALSAVARLADHPNIAGIKETSTDAAQFADLSAAVPDDFTVLCGAAPGVLGAISAGARGAIIAIASLMPRECLELVSLVRAGRMPEALAMQHRITPLGRAVTTGYGIAGLKAALDLAGFTGGDPRPPLRPLPDDAREQLRTLLHAAAMVEQ
jgi:4-hydroxy-2-oxoglutarate aldolase